MDKLTEFWKEKYEQQTKRLLATLDAFQMLRGLLQETDKDIIASTVIQINAKMEEINKIE